ncbi:MAG TPA: hypothetical protein VFB62_11830 [Polyangiaceae bacterium]|jgi:hypothetical protein|nr:hypothetical protein [Polyangiaceae bacterium]
MSERALRRLRVLQSEADQTPVPTRKYFHIGQPEIMEDVGECVPMISWVDDNLSRYVITDIASSAWGRETGRLLTCLPNVAVQPGDGVLVVTGSGHDESVPHPAGKGKMHFVHLGLKGRLFESGIAKLYVYRLEGVQVKGMAAKPAG